MKKLSLSVTMILCVVVLHAEKVTKGSSSFLARENTICVKIDYSDSQIDRVPFDVFLEGEENWEEGYREILRKYVKAINQHGGGIKYVTPCFNGSNTLTV